MNKYIFILIAMLFCHVFDDYVLQGCLANLKQKQWWENQTGYNKLYKYDYIPALICHSISWSFMIMLPIAIGTNFNLPASLLCLFFINVIIHASTDNLKANLKIINLVQDQLIHLVQIILTFITYLIYLQMN